MLRPCPYCGLYHDTTACPPKYTGHLYTQVQEPVMVWNTLYKGRFSPTLTLIPSDYLYDGQRVPAGNDSWFVSRAEYDRLAQAVPPLTPKKQE